MLSRIALTLALLLPIYLFMPAVGAKLGLWDWKFGLGTLLFKGAPILLGLTALLAIIALIMVAIRKPRNGWLKPLIALAIPLGIVGSVAATAGNDPIHDVSTDTVNPPAFSVEVMAARAEAEANPLNNYATPLGELEMWAQAEEPLKSQTHAEIITSNYPELEPLRFEQKSKRAVSAAVMDAMFEIGIRNISISEDETYAYGVATSFWFEFEDDIVARIGPNQVDFRSVSRVGQSDLGANAKRIAELRANVEARLAE